MSQPNSSRKIRIPTPDQTRAAMRHTRAALAKAAGVEPADINVEQLDQAVEKAAADVCKAVGVPPGTIQLTVSLPQQAA